MAFRLTILCDNSVGPVSGTLGEHGFSALIEGEGAPLLFDTGQGSTLLHNAQRMGKDLRRVEQVILSHGHYDHSGGLWPLLATCGPKEILAHPALFSQRYKLRQGEPVRSIGIPYAEEFIRGQGGTFSLSDEPRLLATGALLTGSVPRMTTYETGDAGLFCDTEGCHADHVADDQSLILTGSRGLVILLGCCHAGLINTIDHARQLTGIDSIQAVIGGTHLGFVSLQQVEETIKGLRQRKVAKIIGGHCTGFAVASRLAREFPGHFHPAQVGYTLEVA
jgi:7,8-dihydropterin-6-yl-methyl-4-(beta-D-ribofuranosyl)aminobenzene 5'-phosphate synthase